jgi:pentatricopeptide repeat protein
LLSILQASIDDGHRRRTSSPRITKAPPETTSFDASIAKPASYEDVLVLFRENGDLERLWVGLRALGSAHTAIENAQLNSIMMACIQRKKPELAIRIFHELEPLVSGGPNVECYTTLIVAHGRLKQADKAVRILADLHSRCRSGEFGDDCGRASLRPSLRTYNAVMNACIAAGDVDKAHEVFGDMVDVHHMAPNEVSYNILLKSHARRGRVEAMQLVLDQMRSAGCEPTLITYTTLLKGYVNAGDVRKAEEVLNDILYKKRMRPDGHLFNCLLEGYVRINDWKRALKLADIMRQHGLMPDGYTNTLLVRVCILAGRIDLAEKIIERMPRPLPVQIYSMMISGYGASGRLWSALRLAKEMRTDGISENIRTVSAQMSACLQAREPALALGVFLRVMREDPSFSPDQVIYTLLIRANGQRADAENAYRVFSLLKTKQYALSTDVYNALIEAAMHGGRPDIALAALDELIEKGLAMNAQTFHDLTCVCLWDKNTQHKFLAQVWDRLQRLDALIDGRFYVRMLEAAVSVGDLALAETLVLNRWAGHFDIDGSTAQEARIWEAELATSRNG